MCLLDALHCVCNVLGHLTPVHRCARSARCVACAVYWNTSFLFTGVQTRCVVLSVRCMGPLVFCSCTLGVLCGMYSVLGHLAPVHRCARPVRCVACAVSSATRLLFTDVPFQCVVLRMRCPGPIGSCSRVCPLGALGCLCGVLGHLALVHRCARFKRCVVCAVSWATELPLTGLHARCVVLCLWCIGPLGSCSPLCTLGVLYYVCGVSGHLAPVHRCGRSVRCVACAVSWDTWLLFTCVLARCVLLRVQCLGQLGACSPMCLLGALRCVCNDLGHLAPVYRCGCSVRCVACAMSWAT